MRVRIQLLPRCSGSASLCPDAPASLSFMVLPSLRDDDDINDVASMAGVNLTEESANILATNSELVGTVTRSCKDETFLSPSLLSLRALEIGEKGGGAAPSERPLKVSPRLLTGKRFGVGELGADVVRYISHAAQQRLQDLLEKVSHAAQLRSQILKVTPPPPADQSGPVAPSYDPDGSSLVHQEDGRHEQVGDVRAQLKFFEQLDQLERQRKEEQEREILLKAAKVTRR